jgi:hypothetical protein
VEVVAIKLRWCQIGELIVLGNKVTPFFGNILFYKNSVYRTSRDTRTAVNTFFRVDVKLVIRFINAGDRTHVHTGLVFDPDTGFTNDVRHEMATSFQGFDTAFRPGC